MQLSSKTVSQSEDIGIDLLCNQTFSFPISQFQCAGCFHSLTFLEEIFMADFSHRPALFLFTDVILSLEHAAQDLHKVLDEGAYFHSCCMCSSSWLDWFSQITLFQDIQWPNLTFGEPLSLVSSPSKNRTSYRYHTYRKTHRRALTWKTQRAQWWEWSTVTLLFHQENVA